MTAASGLRHCYLNDRC